MFRIAFSIALVLNKVRCSVAGTPNFFRAMSFSAGLFEALDGCFVVLRKESMDVLVGFARSLRALGTAQSIEQPGTIPVMAAGR